MIATLSLVGFTSSYLKPKVVSATVLEAKPIEPITIEANGAIYNESIVKHKRRIISEKKIKPDLRK